MSEVEKRVSSLRKKVDRLERDLAQAKRDLAHAYEDRFPEGRFFIVRYEPWSRRYAMVEAQPVLPALYYEICFEGKTASSKVGRKNIVLTTNPNSHGQVVEGHPNLRQGRWRTKMRHRCLTTQYATIEKMQAAAQKFSVPPALVEAFTEHYNKLFEVDKVSSDEIRKLWEERQETRQVIEGSIESDVSQEFLNGLG